MADEEKDQYWIKQCTCAIHSETGTRMFVDKVVTREKDNRKLIVGIKTHWIDSHGGYQTGMFMTMELEPCKKD